MLENCGHSCHLWIELDIPAELLSMDSADGPDRPSMNPTTSERAVNASATVRTGVSIYDLNLLVVLCHKWAIRYPYYTKFRQPLSYNILQTVTYSIMIYYTPAFEAMESDMEGYIATIFAEINEGYANTDIPRYGCRAPMYFQIRY